MPNIGWGSTCMTNLKNINSQQKHTIRIIFNKNKFALRRKQLNILSTIIFKHRVENETAPSYFSQNFVNLRTPIQQIFRLTTF